MSNILVSWKSEADNQSVVTINGSNESANYPFENLQNFQPGKPFRTTSGSVFGQWLQIDLGSAKWIDFIGWFRTNILVNTNNQWRIRLGSNPTPSIGNLYDSGLIDIHPDGTQTGVSQGWTDCWHKFPGVSARYIWIDINVLFVDTPIYTGLSIGRLHVSNAHIPAVNMSYDWAIGYVDRSRRTQTLGGATFVNARPLQREVKFTLEFADEEEMFLQGFRADRYGGLQKDAYVHVDIDNLDRAMDYSIYGMHESLPPVINHNYGLFKKSYVVRELL